MSIIINGNKNLKFIKAVYYQPVIPPPPQIVNVGDIAYWDGSSVKTISLSSWDTSLGTPVGVVMIPENFLPDGKARIISLTNMAYNGDEYICWDSEGGEDTDSPAPTFEFVPTTDNAGSTTIGYNYSGYLPSDKDAFTGDISYTDSKSKYYYTIDELMEWGEGVIPSPYLGDVPNPAYYQTMEETVNGGNMLSDFNGLSNTQLLVTAGENYHAAYACLNYKDVTNSNLQWYLPAMGELGYLMARLKQINESIQAVGGTIIDEDYYWSSTECFDGELYSGALYTLNGFIYNYYKSDGYYIRACSLL